MEVTRDIKTEQFVLEVILRILYKSIHLHKKISYINYNLQIQNSLSKI